MEFTSFEEDPMDEDPGLPAAILGKQLLHPEKSGAGIFCR
jgi:hypothetical protein